MTLLYRKQSYEHLRFQWLPGRRCESCGSPDELTIEHRLGRAESLLLDVAHWSVLCQRCRQLRNWMSEYPNPT